MYQFTESLVRILLKVPRDADKRPTKEVWLMGRSNGANRTLEWLNDFAQGGQRTATLASGDISGFLLAGLVSPNSKHFSMWRNAELTEAKENPNAIDPISMFIDHINSHQMQWANPRVGEQSGKPHVRIPPIIAIVSGQDNYMLPEYQIEALETFSKNNPLASITLLLSPAKHDPTASFEYFVKDPNTGELVRKKMGQGKFLRQVVRDHVNGTATFPDGLRHITYPGYHETPRCPELLRLMKMQ